MKGACTLAGAEEPKVWYVFFSKDKNERPHKVSFHPNCFGKDMRKENTSPIAFPVFRVKDTYEIYIITQDQLG